MIEDFRSLAVFVAVADAGSFSAAGRRLQLSTSVVSHHLSRLESKLGVTLFYRSTRSMSLTAEGQSALPSARRMVEAGEEALDLMGMAQDELVGALRVTMPAWGEQLRLRQSLWEFAKLHPLVAISLHSSDRPADLVKDGFDLAIRLGTLSDSSLKSVRIGEFQRILVASPGYLSSRPAIKTIEDLASCDFIAIARLPDTLDLHHKGTTIRFEPENFRIEVDTIASATSAACGDLGLRALPRGEVEQDIVNGRLVHVLPRHTLPKLGVYAVWPDSGPQKVLTRRLIDYLRDSAKN